MLHVIIDRRYDDSTRLRRVDVTGVTGKLRKHPIAPSEHPVLIISGLYDFTRGNQFDAVLTWNTLEFSGTTRSKPH